MMVQSGDYSRNASSPAASGPIPDWNVPKLRHGAAGGR